MLLLGHLFSFRMRLIVRLSVHPRLWAGITSVYTLTWIRSHKNYGYVQGVQEKLWFFSQFTATPHSPTSLFRDLQSSQQRNAGVQSLLLAGNFLCTNKSSRVLARERWQTLENSWEKTQYIMNTLYKMLEPGQSLTLAKTTRSERIEKLEFATACLSVLCLN